MPRNQETVFIIIFFMGVSLFAGIFSAFLFPGYPFRRCDYLGAYDRDDIEAPSSGTSVWYYVHTLVGRTPHLLDLLTNLSGQTKTFRLDCWTVGKRRKKSRLIENHRTMKIVT